MFSLGENSVQIETVALSSLLPDPANARRHDEKNLAAIKGSLAKFGQRKPIVCRNNVVIAGNGTLEAAKQLGWSEIQIVRADDMTNTDATAFALADNRSAELASWDFETLGATLHALREDDFDLTEIGFDTSYLDNMNLPDVDTNIDDTDSEPATKFELRVSFDNEDDQQELFIELRDRGLKVKV